MLHRPMDGALVRRASSHAKRESDVANELFAALGQTDYSGIVIFMSPNFDAAALMVLLRLRYPHAALTGCTTAGEIGPDGYQEESVVAIGLPRSHFQVETAVIDLGHALNSRRITAAVLNARNRAQAVREKWHNEFALLLVDGLTMMEDRLVSALVPALGTTQLFGGSAGDALAFGDTFVFVGDKVMQNAAVVVIVRTNCNFRVFRYDNFLPTETRMVVTGADPEKRIVTEINGELAAPEYARIVGKDPAQLSASIFAAHPVVVRIAGQHHVRAIYKVDATEGHLHFFSAIEEGLILTVARALDMTEHLDMVLTDLGADVAPEAILVCDCILRRLDAMQSKTTAAVSAVLAKHGAIGFSTYGEQHNALHVNHTITGVAIYPSLDGGAS